MFGNHNNRSICILLVEDNPGDVRLTLEALKEVKVQSQIFHVQDGLEALAFLHKQGEYSDAPLPDIILLDLNMPGKDGRELLTEVKADPDLKRIPVVVLTVSSDEKDIRKSYELYANCYIVKPLDVNEYANVVRSIEQFWFYTVQLPTRVNP